MTTLSNCRARPRTLVLERGWDREKEKENRGRDVKKVKRGWPILMMMCVLELIAWKPLVKSLTRRWKKPPLFSEPSADSPVRHIQLPKISNMFTIKRKTQRSFSQFKDPGFWFAWRVFDINGRGKCRHENLESASWQVGVNSTEVNWLI